MINTVDNSKFSNDWYNPGRNSLIRLAWYFVNSVVFQSYLFPIYGVKNFLLRLFGASIGVGVIIKPSVNIKYPWHLKIGNHVWIGENVWIDNLADVTIGDSVCISQGALILTGNHNYSKKSFDLILGKTVIEDGVWIGARSVVCPGISCKSHSILTAGSVASKNMESYCIYQGIPALKVRSRVIKE